jgi:hypothetical protein
MGTLRDEVYERLDYLSQLTEVVLGPQNELLADIPDRIELSLDDIMQVKSPTWNLNHSLDVEILRVLRARVPEEKWHVLTSIRDHFAFEVSPNFMLDLRNQVMVGTIALVKRKTQMDEKRMLELALESAERELLAANWPSKQLRTRVVTVMNTLEPNKGNEWAAKHEGRVAWPAQRAIYKLLRDVILENKWRVREASVIVRMGTWINSYLSDSDGGVGLVNLVKLKIMVDKDVPVYSIEEVKSVKAT